MGRGALREPFAGTLGQLESAASASLPFLVAPERDGSADHRRHGPLVYLKLKNVRARIVARNVQVVLGARDLVEIQLGAKARSKAEHTMFAGYANGIVAYIPVAKTIQQGGMSVSSAVRTYNIPAPPTEAAVDDVLAAFGGVLEELGL